MALGEEYHDITPEQIQRMIADADPTHQVTYALCRRLANDVGQLVSSRRYWQIKCEALRVVLSTVSVPHFTSEQIRSALRMAEHELKKENPE